MSSFLRQETPSVLSRIYVIKRVDNFIGILMLQQFVHSHSEAECRTEEVTCCLPEIQTHGKNEFTARENFHAKYQWLQAIQGTLFNYKTILGIKIGRV